jgi:hypothetical protein
MRAFNYILRGHDVVPEPDLDRWGQWMIENKYRYRQKDPEGMDPCRVGSDHVGGVWVSTTFLGLDCGYLDEGPPIVFETMLWVESPEADGVLDALEWRYATWEEAESGHAHVLAWIRAGHPGDEPDFLEPLP